MNKPIKLNLGCGKKHKEGYINIDAQGPCDLKHDLRMPLPFDNDSVDEIYSKDVIQLFSRQEWKRLKSEIVRVLKPNGKLEIFCDDFEYVLTNFLTCEDEQKRWEYWILCVFAGQGNEFDYFKNAFTYEKLVSDLRSEGMEKFERGTEPEFEGWVHLTCHKQQVDYQLKPNMKILIGTPIHESKNYCIERWLKNVAELQKQTPADLLMVDTSVGLDYVEKVKSYCAKYGVANYKIKHLEISEFQPWEEKVGRSWETIRRKILSNDYSAWFSWGCDRIIPANALNRLATIMEAGNYMLVGPSSWGREAALEPTVNFSCALIERTALQKYGFSLDAPDMPDCWAASEEWFKKRLLKGGGSYIEIYGIINPICQLKE